MRNGAIVFLAAVVVLLGCCAAAYLIIRRRIKRFSRCAFGTSSLAEGVERQAKLLAETPKSVSGMTRIFVPQIQRDFPEFDLEKFKNRAENTLTAMLLSVQEEKLPDSLAVSPELRKQAKSRIEGNRASGIREHYLNIKIHRTEVADYRKRQGTCTIVFQSAVEHIHYKEKNGSVISGRKDLKEQTKYNVELMYIQDASAAGLSSAVGTVCPQCGAPVTALGSMRCEYCGTKVTPVQDRVWSLQKYYEVDYHHV